MDHTTSAVPATLDPEALKVAARSVRHPFARALLVLTFTTGLVDAVIETWVEPDGDSRSRLRHRIEYRFRGGPLGDLAARAVRMFGARSLLRRGVQAQKRQAESSG